MNVALALALTLAVPQAQATPAPSGVYNMFPTVRRQPYSVWSGAAADGLRETIMLRGTGGVVLRGWFYPSADPAAPYIVTFHGRGETMEDAYTEERDEFFNATLNLNVVTFDYSGTGFSGGATSVAASRADALAIFDYAAKRANGRPVFVCGWSLGSVFASHVAGSRKLAGLILLSPVSNMATLLVHINNVKSAHYVSSPELDAGIDNDRELRSYRDPLLVVHGTADAVVPIDEGRADFAAAASTDKEFIAVPGKGHGGTIWSIEADDAIAKFILKHSHETKAGN